MFVLGSFGLWLITFIGIVYVTMSMSMTGVGVATCVFLTWGLCSTLGLSFFERFYPAVLSATSVLWLCYVVYVV